MPRETRREPGPAVRSRRRGLALLAGSLILLAIPNLRTEAGRVDPDGPLRVDPNTAPAMLLETLPRIGPVLAARIVAAREVRPFADADDLDGRVKGIGPATIAGIRPLLRFDDPASPPNRER